MAAEESIHSLGLAIFSPKSSFARSYRKIASLAPLDAPLISASDELVAGSPGCVLSADLHDGSS